MSFLLYGAYGYTGRLIAERALERGLRPVLAARHSENLT
ncbi:MAG: saccharopine dehydrogenase, partial [Bacteroidetes bacterium]|nr:saccharopine dehydrogenase [Bacteroidota bacterium]